MAPEKAPSKNPRTCHPNHLLENWFPSLSVLSLIVGGVLHVRKWIFAENCHKKAHFGRFFNPNSAEFRGDFGNHRNRPQADRNQETTAFALDSTGGRPVSFVRVSNHAISPQNHRFLQEGANFRKNAKMMVHSGRKRSVALLFRLSSHSV